MLLSEQEIRAITEKILSYTRADDATVIVSGGLLSHLRLAQNQVTTSGERKDKRATIAVWIKSPEGMRRGSAASNGLDDASLRQMVAEAEQLARLSPVDPEYLPTLGKQNYRPVTHGYVEATASPALEARARVVRRIISDADKAGVVGAGFHQAGGTAMGTATRNGNFSYRQFSTAAFTMSARTPDGLSSGYAAGNHFDIQKLDPSLVAREAIRRTLAGRNAQPVEPGVYPVILEAQAFGDIWPNVTGFRGGMFFARSAEEGRTVFSAPNGKTRVGEQVFDERLQIYSDPWHPDLPGSPAAQDGLPAEKLYLVRNGVLEQLIDSRYWAQRQGRRPTPGPTNLIIEATGPTASVEEMIRQTKRALLITRFWYIRSLNPRTESYTGLTRDGVWLVEDGKIKHPVRNLRFNQSIVQMLAPGNVEMIGRPQRINDSGGSGMSASLVPALKLKAFTFSSQSDAV